MIESHPAFAHYFQLLAKADAHWERVEGRHAAALSCRLGCTACCQQDLSVSPIEAAHIRAHLAEHGVPPHDGSRTDIDQHALFETLAHGKPCSFLSTGGGCGIYEARPLICRTHGLPVLVEDEVEACPLNFQGEHVELRQDDVLNLNTLNTMLAMINQVYTQTTGEDERVQLSALRAGAE